MPDDNTPGNGGEHNPNPAGGDPAATPKLADVLKALDPATAQAIQAAASGLMTEARNKWQTEADAKATTLQKQLDAMKQASETEQEKAVREAEERGKGVVKAEYEARLRALSIQTELVAAGASAEAAADLARLAPPDGDPKEVAKAIKERFAPLFAARSKSHGGEDGRSATSPALEYTPERIEEELAKLKTHDDRAAWWAKHGAAVEDAQRRTIGATKSMAPGEGLQYVMADDQRRRKR
jgi:hypothetical protein